MQGDSQHVPLFNFILIYPLFQSFFLTPMRASTTLST